MRRDELDGVTGVWVSMFSMVETALGLGRAGTVAAPGETEGIYRTAPAGVGGSVRPRPAGTRGPIPDENLPRDWSVDHNWDSMVTVMAQKP